VVHNSVFDSNHRCSNVEIMQSLTWNSKTLPSSKRAWFVAIVYSSPTARINYSLYSSSFLLGICLHNDHRLFCRLLRHFVVLTLWIRAFLHKLLLLYLAYVWQVHQLSVYFEWASCSILSLHSTCTPVGSQPPLSI